MSQGLDSQAALHQLQTACPRDCYFLINQDAWGRKSRPALGGHNLALTLAEADPQQEEYQRQHARRVINKLGDGQGLNHACAALAQDPHDPYHVSALIHFGKEPEAELTALVSFRCSLAV